MLEVALGVSIFVCGILVGRMTARPQTILPTNPFSPAQKIKEMIQPKTNVKVVHDFEYRGEDGRVKGR